MSRLLLLAILIYLFLLAALIAVNGDLLALAAPLVVYLAVAFLFRPTEVRLSATRSVTADRTLQRASVNVTVSVTNQGADLEQALIEDRTPPSVRRIAGHCTLLTSLPAGRTATLEYTAEFKRGGYELDEVQITAAEHLGLVRRQMPLSAPARLSVLPQPLKLRRLAIRPLRTRAQAGPVPARVGGSGVVFHGVREYHTGDPRRWINWRVTARHPRGIFTNEFEQERIADVGLILDARARSEVQLESDSLFEHAVQATASLAQAFLSDGNRVGLLVYGRFADWTFPGCGRVQRQRILQALARAEPGQSCVFDDLDNLPTRFFPAQSQIVLISPLCPEDVPMLVRLRARGYQVLIIRPDAVAFESQAMAPTPSVELARRLVLAERRLVRRRLLQAGIQVVDWRVDRPFDQAVHASLGRTPHWARAVGVEL